MNMLKKPILLLLALSALRFLLSCCGEKDFNFRWTNATMKRVVFTGDSWQSPPPATVQKDSAGLSVLFEYEFLAALTPPGYGYNQAAAWSCHSNSTNKDTLVAINLVTRFTFDNAHPAGSSLNDLPIAFIRHNDSLNRYRPVSELLREANGYQGASPFAPELIFRFNKTTPVSGQHRFVLTLTTASGRIFQDSADLQLR